LAGNNGEESAISANERSFPLKRKKKPRRKPFDGFLQPNLARFGGQRTLFLAPRGVSNACHIAIPKQSENANFSGVPTTIHRASQLPHHVALLHFLRRGSPAPLLSHPSVSLAFTMKIAPPRRGRNRRRSAFQRLAAGPRPSIDATTAGWLAHVTPRLAAR
jgi:hypothetical protein